MEPRLTSLVQQQQEHWNNFQNVKFWPIYSNRCIAVNLRLTVLGKIGLHCMKILRAIQQR